MTLNQAAPYKLAGRVLFGFGAASSMFDAYQGRITPSRAAQDIAMSAIGTWGGPLGLAAAATYFGSEYAIEFFGIDQEALSRGAPAPH